MGEDADDGVPPDVVIVHLTRRTLPQQVEWLITQVSFLVAKVNRLERESETLRLDAEGLRARLRAVERATPWYAPKKPTGPPVDPLDHPRHFPYAHTYEEAMTQLEAEAERLRRHQAGEDPSASPPGT